MGSVGKQFQQAVDAARLACMSVTLQDIEAAARRIAGQAVQTPLLASEALARATGAAAVYLKPEMLQVGGAFKFRGAFNRLAQLTAQQRRAGVVAFSSGNHAQGVAIAAARIGCPALIVIPSDAPRIKIEATRAAGAEVRLYDRASEDREAIAAEIALARGAVVVPAFEDVDIIAGQGTLGLEMVRQAQAAGGPLDVLICPTGGGGLIAGVSTAMRALSPDTEIWGVEPQGFDDTARSLAAGHRLGCPPGATTLCDALMSPMPGATTFAINRRTLSGVLAVTDAEVKAAMRFAFEKLKLAVEPGGAAALAAALSPSARAGRLDLDGRRVGIVLSGGNVDPDQFAAILTEAPTAEPPLREPGA
jgi:threonine dehydratase